MSENAKDAQRAAEAAAAAAELAAQEATRAAEEVRKSLEVRDAGRGGEGTGSGQLED